MSYLRVSVLQLQCAHLKELRKPRPNAAAYVHETARKKRAREKGARKIRQSLTPTLASAAQIDADEYRHQHQKSAE
jgi:hypothetical protein